MSDLPELTVCLLTYKRPWYALIALRAWLHNVAYAGPKKFHIADGGSPQREIDAYRQVLNGQNYSISASDNLSDMVNSCAKASGGLWIVALDDYLPRKFDLTPDARFLLANQDVGAIRMGRLAFWEDSPNESIEGQLRGLGGLHWWVFDKARTTHPYICAINATLYHRRFWNDYGDISPCQPTRPGEAEKLGAQRYNALPGCAIAIPMRFGEDCADWQEPIWHMGAWRTDEYAAEGNHGYV